MSAGVVADSLLLVIAVAALGAAALRCAATLTAGPLPRLIAAAGLGAAAAVLEALALGLVALGGSPGALSGLAVATWLAVRRLTPAPLRPLGAEVRTALSGAGVVGLAGAGAVAGLLLGVVMTELHRPVLGQDAVTYHLPEVIGFIQSGHTGRVLNDFYGLPVGNYPLTEEVLLAWAIGISHGFAASILLTVATVPLLLFAGWLALAELGVNRVVAVLALAALALIPLVLEAWTQPGTDLEAFTWLVCCVALCLAARRDRGLLAAALVAGALGVGTKTTVVSWVLVTLAVTAWFQRGALRTHWRQLLAAAALAVVTGLTWYVRNWIDHGSPLWPFSSFPGGDPRPRLIDYLSTSLLDSFHRTLLDHLRAYAAHLSGGAVLVLGGILCALPGLVLGRRRLILAGVVVLAGALEYAAGPVTGLPANGFALVGVIGSTLRYLMPVFGAGALALALAASDRNRVVAGLAGLGLVGTLVWDVITDAGARFELPFDGWLIPAALLGMLALPALAVGLRRLPAHPTREGVFPRWGPAVLELVIAALATAAVAVGSTHFNDRNAATRDFAAPVSAFLQTQPGYADTQLPVATSGTGLAQLAGDRLQHPLSVIPEHARCGTVAADRLRGWVVTEVTVAATRAGVLSHVVQNGTADGCLSHVTPVFDNGQYAVYAPSTRPLRISGKVS